MTKIYFKSLEEIQNHLRKGLPAYWCHALYEVHFVDNQDIFNQYSRTDDKVIRVSCVTNYFGSFLDASEIGKCFYFEGESK